MTNSISQFQQLLIGHIININITRSMNQLQSCPKMLMGVVAGMIAYKSDMCVSLWTFHSMAMRKTDIRSPLTSETVMMMRLIMDGGETFS
mmetsp:Transcript_15695/g.17463  ORF Transcript_15695/g.17463 Transcript_15695/m.17463 type:complete len:90 (+) Transcript_15695:1623-1892(+)